MKTLTLLTLLVISSCALYEEIVTPAPKAKPIETETQTAIEVVPTVPAVPFENMISKNWDYSERIGTYTALTNSVDKKATLMVVKNDQGNLAIGIEVPGKKMSYREGHSIELKLDGEPMISQVESSKDKASESVRFADPKNLIKKLKNKKNLKVELLINNEGMKYFDFDISGLQEFFFI